MNVILGDRWKEARQQHPPIELLSGMRRFDNLYRFLCGSPTKGVMFGFALFLCYYALPNLVASVEGVGVSHDQAVKVQQVLGPHEWVEEAARSDVNVPAFGDLVHLIFSVAVVFLGPIIALTILRLAPNVISLLVVDSGLTATEEDTHRVERWLVRRLGTPLIFLLPAVGSLCTLFSFSRLVISPDLLRWWGHGSYGIAGYILAFNVAVVVGLGILYVEVLTGIFVAIYRMFRAPMRLRPLHPDGCGGFLPLGILFVYVYLIFALGGIGFVAVGYVGYFGLEHTPLYWGTVMVYLFALFVVVFAPLVWFAVRIDHEKRRVLRRIEARAGELRSWVCGDPLDTALPSLEEVSIAREMIETHPVLPFGGRTLAAISGGYALQCVASVYAIFR